MALKFIHTADWQLGARAHFIPGDAGARIRSARLEVVRRIGELARREGAAFVVVAGDVFENHAVKPDTIRQALDAMRAGGVPFYLRPARPRWGLSRTLGPSCDEASDSELIPKGRETAMRTASRWPHPVSREHVRARLCPAPE